RTAFEPRAIQPQAPLLRYCRRHAMDDEVRDRRRGRSANSDSNRSRCRHLESLDTRSSAAIEGQVGQFVFGWNVAFEYDIRKRHARGADEIQADSTVLEMCARNVESPRNRSVDRTRRALDIKILERCARILAHYEIVTTILF